MKDQKVMCVMTAGAPLTEQVRDVLLVNAIDMWDERNHSQQVKTRAYTGIIQSNLEITETFGVPVVMFEAVIGTPDFRSTEVQFVIRIDDLENMQDGEWCRIMMASDMPFAPNPQQHEWN